MGWFPALLTTDAMALCKDQLTLRQAGTRFGSLPSLLMPSESSK
jgi:hypothetical protein